MSGDDRCPDCGIAARTAVRVRHRKRRKNLNTTDLLRHGALGVFVALIVAALLSSIFGGFGARSGAGSEAPTDLAVRWAIAWNSLQSTLTQVSSGLAQRGSGAVPFLIIGLVGGIVGTLYYLRREGSWGSGHSRDDASSGQRRRRRI